MWGEERLLGQICDPLSRTYETLAAANSWSIVFWTSTLSVAFRRKLVFVHGYADVHRTCVEKSQASD